MKFNKLLKEKVFESIASVIPITAIVLFLSMTIAPMETGALVLFLFGAFLLVLGMGFFTLGADMSMIPMGEGIGVVMSKSKKIAISLLACLILGILITVAEPDLQVLANQVPAVPNPVLILTVAAGVGIFLVVAQLRMLFKIPLSFTLLFFYLLIFLLVCFTQKDFIPVSFDSGGVTTGPITVPFIMALGIGMASVRSDKDSNSDSFGLISLCSIGPILAVLILGMFYKPQESIYAQTEVAQILTTKDAAREFVTSFPHYAKEVFAALFPIILLFVVFQLVFRRFQNHQIMKVVSGIVYTYIGLVLFLTGVNVGFMPAGQLIGKTIAAGEQKWLLVPIGMVIGYFIVKAEPAVQVLIKQVEEVSNGSITKNSIAKGLSIGVALSVGISMFRILTGIPILVFLIAGYVISLGLTFVVPQIFTGIAFDSGGVASGPMTAAFLLPLAMGACEALGGNILTDAFGIVAMVAMTPLVTIQIIGLVSKLKENRKQQSCVPVLSEMEDSMVYFE